jgi:hypothetical protein
MGKNDIAEVNKDLSSEGGGIDFQDSPVGQPRSHF